MTRDDATPDDRRPRRADLHCHSAASCRPAEAGLRAVGCPECFSAPAEVYLQARRRGMDFVTITDHDTLDGVTALVDDYDHVLVGEELTCWFPEDGCKMHVLVYGLTADDHAALQDCAKDIYEVARYVERARLAHSVAHPLYRQNDKLERWHLERLLLLFKGFECLNGAHSAIHRDAFEPVLNRLTRGEMERLGARHRLLPLWPEPWYKARTAGSDDHGLLNVGRTYTEFPPDTRTVADVLRCLREGACQPAGEAGSSPKLAHTFYSVAVRYYGRSMLTNAGAGPNGVTKLLQTIVGERPAPRKRDLVAAAFKSRVDTLRATLAPKAGPAAGAGALLEQLFLASAKDRLGGYPQLRDALGKGLPPLGEHAAMFDFASAVNADVTRGIAGAFARAKRDARFTGFFDAASALLGQQFMLAPYYFALFHQNKERHLLRQITGDAAARDPSALRVGLFTDTLDDTNGVARFIRDMAATAADRGRSLTVHTSVRRDLLKFDVPGRKNFEPLLDQPLPYYEQLSLGLPPVLSVLEWADRQQFDVVHVSTPGPVGLCGYLVARMLRVPVVGTYHTDFPAYVDQLTGDHRIGHLTVGFMKWLYGQMPAVLSRSKSYRFKLHDLGVADDRVRVLPPAIDTRKFAPERRDVNVWADHDVAEPRRLLYVGRVSTEKNLPLLADTFRKLCRMRRDTALVVAGDGPYLAEMRAELKGLPARFLGTCDDAALVPLYAGADLFVFPSRTDTLGQVVMEAQSCGLPAIVSNDGGPKEVVDDDVTGVVCPSADPDDWCTEIDALLCDEFRRQRMSRAAAARAKRFDLGALFDAFWSAHAAVVATQLVPDDEKIDAPPFVPARS